MSLSQYISARQIKIVITGSVFLIAIVIYMLFFSAPVGKWFELNTELKRTGNKLVSMEQALHRRGHLEALCKKYEQRILATGTDAEELGFLLKELESLTRTRKVNVKSIRPLPSQLVGSYKKFLVELEARGRVQNILELIYSVDTSEKLLVIESLKIQALRTGPNLLSVNILISRTSAGRKTVS